MLGCAFKPLDVPNIESARQLSRAKVESGLIMAGVLIMQNRLKPETLPAMQQLNSANLESIMVTGDNPLTACYIAQECQMISKYKSIFLSECTQCRASTMESFMIVV